MGESVTAYKGRDSNAIVAAALKMYDEGTDIEQAAVELNVPARTIHRWLAVNAPEEWKQAQQGRAQADYESARKRRDEARKTLELLEVTEPEINASKARTMNWRLAHAREVLQATDQELKHQEWLLERLIRKLYGQEKEVGDSSRIAININLGTKPTHTIAVDAEVVGETKA